MINLLVLIEPPDNCPPWMKLQFQDTLAYASNNLKVKQCVWVYGDKIDYDYLSHLKGIDNLYFWVFHHSHLQTLRLALQRCPLDANLITIANGTSAIPYQGSYVSVRDEFQYYSRVYKNTYVLTYTKYQRDLMIEKLPEKKDTHFVFFGFFHKDGNKPINRITTAPYNIMAVEKANGMKNSGFLLYAIRSYALTFNIPINFTIYMEGARSEYVERYSIRGYNTKLKIAQEISHKELIHALKAVDMFATGSLSDTGNYTLMEAINADCKILAPCVLPYTEYMTQDSFVELYLYSPFDIHNFNEVLSRHIACDHTMKIKDTYYKRSDMYNRLLNAIAKDKHENE